MTSEKANETSGSRAGTPFLLVLFLLGAGIFAAGSFSYRSYERQFRAEVEQRLSAVADLKVSELTQWRTERLGDGSLFFQNPHFSALVRRFLERPDDTKAEEHIQTWLEKCQTLNRYDQIRLLDVRGVTRMAVPAANRAELASLISQGLPELLRSGRVKFQDFYWNEHDQRVYLSVLVPILDEADRNRPLGALTLRIDPETYLYPFIRSWPTPSRTAETLLVRRDGTYAIFLNELKFQTNTALKLGSPLAETNVAAVKAVLGQEGVVECRDYRGVPVVAALRAIPSSPWLLVARMDTAEVYAPLRERLWLTVLLMGALLLAAGASVGMAWRQRHAQHYRERHESTEALIASEVRYRRLFESAKDGILILDAETGMVVDVNPFLIGLLGFTHEQYLGKKVWELGSFKDIVANQAHFAELQQKEYIRYEDRALETADGRRIEVEFVSNVYPVNHRKVIQCNIRDITERKRSGEAFRQEQVFTASLMESLPGIFYLYTYPELRLVRWNKQHESSLGFETGEMMGRHVTDWHVPEAKEAVLNAIEEVMEKGRGSIEASLVAKGSRLVPFVLTGVKFEAEGKRYLMGIGIDIAERKRAEEALRESEERFRRAVVDSPFPMLLHAEDGKILQASNSWCEISGYSREELATIADWTELAYGERKTLVQADIDRLYGLSHRLDEGDYKIRTKRGETRIWDFSSAPLGRLPDGRRLVISMAMDVTERRQAEAALRESEERLAFALQRSYTGGWDLDLVDHTAHQTLEHAHIFGYQSLLPQWTYELFLEHVLLEDRAGVDRLFREAVAAQTDLSFECRIRRADAEVRWIWVAGGHQRDSQGQARRMAGIVQDITERKEAEEVLRTLNTELEQHVIERTSKLRAANEELEAFSYSVSHDLRAPLRHVLGFVEMLAQEAGSQLSEECRRYMKVITDASTEMGELIDDLLAFSRMGRAEMREAPIHLDALVQKTLRGLESATSGRNIVWKIPPLPVVHADPALLKQVFANLLGNAVKYTRPRDPAQIELGCAGKEDGRIILFVRDNGVGFDPQYAHKLFGVFQRLHRADQFEGTGIGLANVRRIISRHGGRTWAEGKVNEGATFYFTLKPALDPVN